MKKVLKAILIVLIILTIAVGVIAAWQWQNIRSIMLGIKENDAEISKRRDENQTQLIDSVNTFMDEPLREMTEEENKQIEEGKISAAEIYQKMFEEKNSQLEQKKDADIPTKDEIVSSYMAELYKLQNEFTARAESTIKQGASYYESIKAHPQDPVARANTVTHFTPIVRGMEKECDAKVEEVISKLKAELEKIKADTSIIGSIRATYSREKQLKLSYYANKYLR